MVALIKPQIEGLTVSTAHNQAYEMLYFIKALVSKAAFSYSNNEYPVKRHPNSTPNERYPANTASKGVKGILIPN